MNYGEVIRSLKKNTMIGFGRDGKFYLKDLAEIKSSILTKPRTVMVIDRNREVIVQSYLKPEAIGIVNGVQTLTEKFVVESKVDGYNVRLVYLKCIDNFIVLQRGVVLYVSRQQAF